MVPDLLESEPVDLYAILIIPLENQLNLLNIQETFDLELLLIPGRLSSSSFKVPT